MTSERLEKSKRYLQNGDDIDRIDNRQFYSPRKAVKIFPGACPVTNRRFTICFIRLNTHFGFEKLKLHTAMGPIVLNLDAFAIEKYGAQRLSANY